MSLSQATDHCSKGVTRATSHTGNAWFFLWPKQKQEKWRQLERETTNWKAFLINQGQRKVKPPSRPKKLSKVIALKGTESKHTLLKMWGSRGPRRSLECREKGHCSLGEQPAGPIQVPQEPAFAGGANARSVAHRKFCPRLPRCLFKSSHDSTGCNSWELETTLRFTERQRDPSGPSVRPQICDINTHL